MKIELENGKYTYVCYDDGRQHALRYGEEWRDLVGDKFVYCLAHRVTELQEQNKALVEALQSIEDYWNRDRNDDAMHNACWHAVETASAALHEAGAS